MPMQKVAGSERPGADDARSKIYLRALSKRFPTIDAALAEIAHLRAVLGLPKGTIHVVSDVHGEFKKLKHIINNASGSLRPLVDRTLGDRLDERERHELLNLIYYPRETFAYLEPRLADDAARRAFVRRAVRNEFEIARRMVCRYSLKEFARIVPDAYRLLFEEMLFERGLDREEGYVDAMIDAFVEQGSELDLLRASAHMVRNLLIYELIVAGDLGDRGPRIDRVIDYVMRQSRVSITWGNHDVTWMAACLGHTPSIATVLRISMRYRRLAQLEEGYGIPMAPLEKLARTVYADDPADRFTCKGEGLRDTQLMSRMQKAIAIIQLKLEGQVIDRNPDFAMADRNLLRFVDPQSGTVAIDGIRHPMLDTHLPTVDWADPCALSTEEEACIDRLRASFLMSPVLWQQMQFVDRKGSMYARRDQNLIFHGCVPVDETGAFLEMELDGRSYGGRALFEALEREVHKAFRTRDERALDLMWYLWTGPLSPLFGKDKMTTFERYVVADKATHKETKNPYFKLIHDPAFCRRVFEDFGVDPAIGLIVNGHVPVKIEEGESPVKQSGKAVTIDGAFSESYGDKGYTLVLRAGRTYLALHHHFESAAEAITEGADIIPTIQEIARFDRLRTVGDTEAGETIRQEIEVLETLIAAYRENLIQEQT